MGISRLTLGEGATPLEDVPTLAEALGVRRLQLKREDRNPSGSHKDRGVLYQVVRRGSDGGNTFVLSSSGNAAVSAAAACGVTGNRLVAFVAPGTAPSKMARLLGSDAVIVECPKPINFARYAARVFGLDDLRGTKDPLASVGYRSLAAEIAQDAPDLDALVTFSSSGISMEGIADGLDALDLRVPLWSVQSGTCVGIVRALDPSVVDDPHSPAGRLGIRNPPNAEALAERLVASGGGALAVTGEAVLHWSDRLARAGIECAPEGGAVLAGIAASPELRGRDVVAIVTGAAYQPPEPSKRESVALDSYLSVREHFIDHLGLEPT